MSAHYVVNCSILLTHLPPLQRPQAARDAGFEAVEFWWPFADSVPGDAEVDGFVRAVADAGVALVALNFAGGEMAAGERGLLSDPARSAEFRDNVDVAIGIAQRLGTKGFNALYGNRIDGVPAEAQDELATENLAHAAARADTVGAAVLVEPLSAVPRYPLRTAADAVAVLDRVGSPSLRLLADLYHLTVNGDDLAAVIETYADRIGHVQIADAPGRGAPGTGTIDFAGHLAHLNRRGYRGHVSLEYVSADEDPFGWLSPRRRGDSPWR
ncbi:hydroxypyruvate isomerase [Mycolicibacterium cosmeticum]|uniref:Hydroxypyruvate isomerase n=1 Tax=Mycolicibacterium cosmeticum TaxID=258533 RepID=W9AY10_MYCCO|nr:TIM barrel protein [Mycolicibacterium cosmeticum]TLH81462.1 hydroxypyruvate isomerase [Mycolicibacterium cosmeticum]CDO10423.1 hydroxypyruvate isomerase [Mycolicibacterium cosmeticum]